MVPRSQDYPDGMFSTAQHPGELSLWTVRTFTTCRSTGVTTSPGRGVTPAPSHPPPQDRGHAADLMDTSDYAPRSYLKRSSIQTTPIPPPVSGAQSICAYGQNSPRKDTDNLLHLLDLALLSHFRLACYLRRRRAVRHISLLRSSPGAAIQDPRP